MGDSANTTQNMQSEDKTPLFYNELIAPLRTEIVESEKARMDFLKYKLVAVAALGAIGLGLDLENSGGGTTFEHIYVLGIIPFVCLYVDLLCHHNTLRIFMIGQYFVNNGCPYENFISEAGKTSPKNGHPAKGTDYFFELEDWALEGSTLLLSVFILIFGIVMFLLRLENGYDYFMLMLIIPGFLGIVLAVGSRERFKGKKDVLFEVAKRLKDDNQKG